MNLKITYPEDFPLYGLDRDMFETKLRSALRFCFYGNTVRQLAGKVDARRPYVVPDVLPLRQVAAEHAFEDCMALDGCRIDDMSAPLRRNLLHCVGARMGLTILEWGDDALPSLDGSDDHDDVHTTEDNATNRQPAGYRPIPARSTRRTSRRWIAVGLCVVAASGTAAWTHTRPVASLSATVVSTSPAQTLRQLASSVPNDQRPYRVSVQIEPQDTEVSQVDEDRARTLHKLEDLDTGSKLR